MYRIFLLLFLYLTYPISLVTLQTPVIITSPKNQSVCDRGTINFTCVVMFTSSIPSAAIWITNNGNVDATTLSGHTRTDDSNGRSAPANVTTVLTVTNVSISDDGTDYTCAQGLNVRSNTVFLTVFGPPGNVTDLSISKITACSFVVQWSRPSSDPVCGTVWYTVIISNEGGVMIITDNTTMTSYHATGLNDSTVYHVSVTASNNAGSSNVTNMMTTTNSSTASPPNITAITPLSDTSFTVNWTISDPSYNYTVLWTNLFTGLVKNFTVSESTNSFTVTGLSKYYNYNVCIAIVGLCGMMKSGCITVYGPPIPEFNYCISYNDGQTALQVISYVTVTKPRTSLLLNFSASHQTGSSSSQSAMCSSLSDMQYNCTAKFAVDINASVDMIESMTVSVSGPYGSASSLKKINQSVEIFEVNETNITENSVTLICQLPCFSPDLQCILYILTTNDMDVNETIDASNITGSVESYSYPTQAMIISSLNSGITYNYCVVLYDVINMMEVVDPACGNFTTKEYCESCCEECCGGCSCLLCYIIAIIIAIIVCVILLVLVLLYWYRKRGKFNKVICFKDETTPASVPLRDESQGDKPRGDNITYGITSYTDKHTTTETRMQDDGTIRDDSISSVPPNNVSSNDWYDKLASDDKRSDDEHPVNTERVHVSEQVQQQQENDASKPHPFFEATEAARQQQQSSVNTVNNNEVLATNSEESTTTTTTTSNNNAANRPPLAPINLYDPIQHHSPVQQHSTVVPHLHTSSGEKYALPSPKLSRATKHADNATADNKEIPPYAKPDKSKKTANKQMPQYSVPDKSKKTANKKNKCSESDVPSPTTDDTTPLTIQKTKDMYVESPSLPAPEDPHP